jgi:Flp pilus assembly pilin Flp
MAQLLGRFLRDETGVDMLEYAMLAAFLVLASYVAMSGMGSSILSFLQEVDEYLGTVEP